MSILKSIVMNQETLNKLKTGNSAVTELLNSTKTNPNSVSKEERQAIDRLTHGGVNRQ